jgi:hypothetical protein
VTRARSGAAPAVDPDEELLRHAARLAGVAVRINARSKYRGLPCVELYDRRDRANALAVFTNAACAAAWLAGRASS